jgi:hypothetical protein
MPNTVSWFSGYKKSGTGKHPSWIISRGQLCGSRAVAKRMSFLNFSRQNCSNLMQFAIESSGCTSSWQRTFDRPHVRSEDRGWWWTLALGLRLESFSALHEGLKSVECRGFPFCWTDMRTGQNSIYAAHCSPNGQAFQTPVTLQELSFSIRDLLTGTSSKCLFRQFWISFF